MLKGFYFFLEKGWKYDKKYIIWLFLLQIVNAVTPVSSALLLKLVIDELSGLGRVRYLALYVLFFAGWICISEMLSSFLSKDCFTRRCRVSAAFDFEMHEKLATADYERLESPSFIDMQAKTKKFLTCDYHGFGYLLDCGVSIFGQIITIAGLLAILITMKSWFILLFAILAVLASLIESKAIQKAMQLSMDVVKYSRLWTYYSELFEQPKCGKEIRMNGIMHWLLGKERQVVGKSIENTARQNSFYIESGLKRAGLSFLQNSIAYGVLIRNVLVGSLGIGSFSMCISALTSFSNAVRGLMDRITEIRAYDLYYAQLDEYLHVPHTLHEGKLLPITDKKHRFEFIDVGFRYNGSANWALRHINITIEPGQRLALVGENGSGKSTFAKLFCRLYDPTEGKILMDGIDIREYDYEKYLELFSAVFQDFQLFECSVRDNILLGKTVEAEELDGIIAKSGLSDRINTLPYGIDTTVGRKFDEEGFEPSGGEAQKIVLARALCRDSAVILLDEPTAAMDPRAEYEMYNQYNNLVADKTSLYISHRLSSCRFCDKIAVLHNGALVEYGSHDELMSHEAEYAELYRMQAQYYIDTAGRA